MSSFMRRMIIPVLFTRVSTLKFSSNNVSLSFYQQSFLNTNGPVFCNQMPLNLLQKRHKSNKKKHYESDDEDEVTNEDDASLSRDSQVVKFSTTSMRTDAILKSALGVARNKIEQVFYESKIRVNGKKIMKKSASVRQGDEIDVIKAVSAKNPDFLHISRVEILNVVPKDDSISVTARRFKSLLIENYEEDSFKGSSENDNK